VICDILGLNPGSQHGDRRGTITDHVGKGTGVSFLCRDQQTYMKQAAIAAEGFTLPTAAWPAQQTQGEIYDARANWNLLLVIRSSS